MSNSLTSMESILARNKSVAKFSYEFDEDNDHVFTDKELLNAGIQQSVVDSVIGLAKVCQRSSK